MTAGADKITNGLFQPQPIREIKPTIQIVETTKLIEAREEVLKLAKLMNEVCGINEFWAKTAIYYCIATHHLLEIEWMVALIILAPPGTGKSYLIDILRELCYKAHSFSCHKRMTAVSLRNELIKAEYKTAVIEEADLYPNRSELESYIISRVSRQKDSGLPMTVQQTAQTGEIIWKTISKSIPGATIIHDRHGLNETAAERRAITISVKHYKGRKFLKPSKEQIESLKLPQVALGNIPSSFNDPKATGSGLDAWEPFIRIANSLGDNEWINEAWKRVIEANEALADGQEWEIEMSMFRGLVAGYCEDKVGFLADSVSKNPLPLSVITNSVRQEYPWVAPKTIATYLRKLGFDVHNKGGVFHIFTTPDQIKDVARELDYTDPMILG